ncbi:MAG TPA: PDZ domain-containing protein [Actinomycetota bacterium]|nr:PDZ domain-containing protein [Actinomycetota bacterium]
MPQAPSAVAAQAVRRENSLSAPVFLLIATLLAFLFLAPRPASAQTPTPTGSPNAEETQSPDNRPVLGILGFTAPENRGVTVARVLPNSGADEGGLENGDIITDVEGTRISSMDDLTNAIESRRVGDRVTITYERNGESRTAEVELGSSREDRFGSPFQTIPDPDFGPNLPDQPQGPDDQSPASSPDYRPVITLFGLLITGALVALIVILVRRDRAGLKPPLATAAPAPATPLAGETRSDPLDLLRLRYARGEITREEFLTMSADLGGPARTTPNNSESPKEQL